MVHFDQGERPDLTPIDHQVEKLLDVPAVELAVDDLQFRELVRNVFREQRL